MTCAISIPLITKINNGITVIFIQLGLFTSGRFELEVDKLEIGKPRSSISC